MANVRDSDTSLWLHNKLGTSNDSWTGGSICSQLNAEVLRNIKDCFPDLQTQVKLKLLLSFFHIPRRNIDEWRVELEEILEVAQMDSESWVSMLAEIMKTLPTSGSLNSDIRDVEENKRIFSDLVNDLKKLVKKKADLGMLPLECHYLSKPALLSLVGQQPQPTKHFTLKRKPKSAALRAELLQKSTDVQNSVKKSPAPTIPLRSRGMPRKVADTTPLKGIPSRVPTGGFRSPPLSSVAMSRTPLGKSTMKRKDGGIKLLDINEQPIGYAQAKKRKRLQDLEDAKKASEEAALKAAEASATPDYAAGLTSLNPPTPVPSGQSVIRETVSTPMPPLTPVTPSTPTTGTTAATASSVQDISTATVIQTNASLLTPLTPVSPSVVQSTPPVPDLTPLQTVQTPNGAPAQVIIQRQAVTQYRIAQPTLVTSVPNQQQSTLRRGLSLTREQMIEAQEMFRAANKVTRPEKALILGFMAGSRENPCPHLGNIVTIKLSENQENVVQTDGTYLTMMVETHFQMNYSTGEWKRIKKLRKIDESMLWSTRKENIKKFFRSNGSSPSLMQEITEDSDLGSFSDSTEARTKLFTVDHGFVPRAGGLVKGLVDNLSLAKFQSICAINDKSVSPRIAKTDVNEVLTKIMLRRGSHMETDWDSEGESKAKLNSVIGIMISTIMCLAARCPVPKSNIQATKLFLSTVVNDNGESPRNIKALLTLLKTYDGPYDGDSPKMFKNSKQPPMVDTNTTTVVLEPATLPPAQPVDRVRASHTRSRLPSLSPSRETPIRGSKTGMPDKLRVSYKKPNYM